ISPAPLSVADHLRQRLKLVRLQHTFTDPDAVATHVESVIARREVRFAALHARRLLDSARARAERRRLFLASPDPFVAWDTPRVLPAEMFYRPPPPACVVALTGIPTSAWGYGGVCMDHLLREDLLRPGRAVPIFAGEVRNGMGVLEKFDPVARRERAERFDVMRVERAVYFAGKWGKREAGRKCLRCRMKGLPCSFERMAGREKGTCEGCRRNRCKWCLRVWDGKAKGEEGWRYVRVKIRRGLKKVEMVVSVKEEEEEVDAGEVRRYAEELTDGEDVSVFGTALDKGAMVLPYWKDAYCKTLTKERALDKVFVEKWTGQEVEQQEVDMEGATSKDYFRLLDQKWRRRHPYQPREPSRG
ncbi:hypothetical protein NKR19_g9137, partial [Coniochaeta hoffmannii]